MKLCTKREWRKVNKSISVIQMLVIWAITGDKCVVQLSQCFWTRIFFFFYHSGYLSNHQFQFQRKRFLYHLNIFFFFSPSILSESGANSYETGIMVSKAVEITISGKLLKPAGKRECYLNSEYISYVAIAQEWIRNLIEISKELHFI